MNHVLQMTPLPTVAVLIATLPSSPWLLQASLDSLEASLLKYDNGSPRQLITVWIYMGEEDKEKLGSLCTGFRVELVTGSLPRGNVVAMWNLLAKEAMKEDPDYLFQTGDDVHYESPGWVEKSIDELRARDNLGVAGPTDVDNPGLATMPFVSSRHYRIFNFFFHPEFTNWFCDSWVTDIYGGRCKMEAFRCTNWQGGAKSAPRYAKAFPPESRRVELNDWGKAVVQQARQQGMVL